MFGIKGGPVPVPPWILQPLRMKQVIIRAFQLLFAILTLAMCAYALSIDGGGPIQPPLISTIIISILTLVPILLLTTPLHLAQRKTYDPRIALLMDGIALLFWLSSFAALASYEDAFSDYGKDFSFAEFEIEYCSHCRRAWKAGVAATVFGAIEFLLFLFSTMSFIYYYHCHLAEVPASGLAIRGTTSHKHDAGNGVGAGTTATGGGVGHHYGTDQHEMDSISPPTFPRAPGTGSGEFRGFGNSQTNITNGGFHEGQNPAPTTNGYGGYQNGNNQGYIGV